MKALVTAVLLSIWSLGFSHKFFISVADMEYSSKTNRINVSLKLIAHDFELLLQHKFDEPIRIENCPDSSEAGLYIQQYLKQNFRLYSNDEKLEFIYLGKEINVMDDLYLYFYFPNVLNGYAIKIVNKLLFSLSDRQQNIVHYKYQDRTKSVTLVASRSEVQLIFD